MLLKIGEELGIPVDIQDQNISIVDAEISKLPVEDVVRQLSPHIRLFLRADLTRCRKTSCCGWFLLSPQNDSGEPLKWVRSLERRLVHHLCCHDVDQEPILTNNDSRRRLTWLSKTRLSTKNSLVCTMRMVVMASEVKKAFVEPTISVPVDVLEATTFFQSATSGATN